MSRSSQRPDKCVHVKGDPLTIARCSLIVSIPCYWGCGSGM